VLVLVGAVLGVRVSSDPVAEGAADDAFVESSTEAGQPSDAALSDDADSREQAALPPVPPSVVDEADRIAAERADSVVGGCGSGLLDEAGDVVVTVAEVTTDPRGGVLVTVDGDDGEVVWWLPSCEASADDAFGRSPR
jgi:hypothetical protein